MKLILCTLVSVASFFANSSPMLAQWVQTNGPEGGAIIALAVSGANLFAGADSGGVFLSTNNGTSWTAASTGLTDTGVVALAVSGTNLFAGTYTGGVFLSTNNGTSWTAVNSGLTSTNVRCLAVSGSNLFAGTSRGVFVSANNGTMWSPVNSGLPLSTTVWSLAVSTMNLFAGTDAVQGFAGTITFAPNSWPPPDSVYGLWVFASQIYPLDSLTGLFSNPPSQFVYALRHLYVDSISYLFRLPPAEYRYIGVIQQFQPSLFPLPRSLRMVTFYSGLSTPDQPLSVVVGEGELVQGINMFVDFHNPPTQPFRVRRAGKSNLFGNTVSGSVWRRPFSEMITSVDGVSPDLPSHFYLGQNYPNPFNSTTIIRFFLPYSQFTTVTLFNVLGEHIATLLSETLPAGTHWVNWNAAAFPTGVYFYRLQTVSFIETKKFILLR